MDSFRPATSSEIATIEDISTLFGTFWFVVLWATSRSESRKDIFNFAQERRCSLHALRGGTEQENISTSSRERSKVCDLHRKRCEIVLCFGETIARLINACFVPFDIVFSFHIYSSQILRAALKPTSPTILPAEQIRAESPPREHVVLSNEDPEIVNWDRLNFHFSI